MRGSIVGALIVVAVALSPQASRAQWIKVLNTHGAKGMVAHNSDLYVSHNNISRTSDYGETWHRADSMLVAAGTPYVGFYGDKLLAGTTFYGLYESTNQGLSWARNMALPNSPVTGFLGTDSFLFVTVNQGVVYRSKDTGQTFDTLLLPEWGEVEGIDTNSKFLFVGTSWGAKIYRSGNCGDVWENVSPSDGSATLDLIATDEVLLSGTLMKGVLRSTDDGLTWTRSSDGITAFRVFSLAASRVGFFSGTLNDGVFWSSNNGASWRNVFDKVGTVNKVYVHGDYLFAGTDDAVYRRPLNDFISLAVEASSHKKLSVLSAQQNSDKFVTIQLRSSTREPIELTLLDVHGRTIRTIPFEPGEFLTFNIVDMATGLYLVRVRSGEEHLVAKVAIVR